MRLHGSRGHGRGACAPSVGFAAPSIGFAVTSPASQGRTQKSLDQLPLITRSLSETRN